VRHFLAGGGHAALPLSADIATVLATIRAALPDAAPVEEERGGLSGREALVLRRKVHGHTNKAIAADLGLSVKTVETYYARAMEKLGLQNRAQVLHYAVDQGWIAGGM
jgi:DNA-binding NarL/FixJ family response regulator